MVLVFDTDDEAGMKSSLKIMRQLLRDYSPSRHSESDPRFGKIEFIKMMRDFQAFAAIQENMGEDPTALLTFKRFSDEVWEQKRHDGYYKPRWRKSPQ